VPALASHALRPPRPGRPHPRAREKGKQFALHVRDTKGDLKSVGGAGERSRGAEGGPDLRARHLGHSRRQAGDEERPDRVLAQRTDKRCAGGSWSLAPGLCFGSAQSTSTPSAPSRPFPAPPFPGHHTPSPAHRSPAGAAGLWVLELGVRALDRGIRPLASTSVTLSARPLVHHSGLGSPLLKVERSRCGELLGIVPGEEKGRSTSSPQGLGPSASPKRRQRYLSARSTGCRSIPLGMTPQLVIASAYPT
jgi:hypothetical protein